MGFLHPEYLWFLLMLPLAFLFAYFFRSPLQITPISSLILWKKLGVISSQPRSQSWRPDKILLLLVCTSAFVIIGSAGPYKKSTNSDERHFYFYIDTSLAGFLKRSDGRSALAYDLPELHSYLPQDFKPRLNPLEHPDSNAIQERIRQAQGQDFLLISPYKYQDLPKNVQTLSYPVHLKSLPFEYANIARNWLYARTTRPDSTWVLQEVGGQELTRIQAQGHELLVQLPQGDHENPQALVLQSTQAQTTEGLYLYPRKRLRIAFQGYSQKTLKALEQAFKGYAEISTWEKTQDPDLLLTSSSQSLNNRDFAFVRAGNSQEIQAFKEKSQGHIVSMGAYSQELTQNFDSLEPLTWLSATSNDQVLLAFQSDRGESFPLILRHHSSKELVCTPELLNQAQNQAWFILFIAQTCRVLLGTDPFAAPSYLIEKYPDSLLKNPETAPLVAIPTVLPAFPKPGLYSDGVINLFAPPAENVWQKEQRPSLETLQKKTQNQTLAWLAYAIALLLLGSVCLIAFYRLTANSK